MWKQRDKKLRRLDTSSGQTLLAFQDDEQAGLMLQAAPDVCNGIPAQIAEELATIREKGYRLGASQQLVGVTDISVPIQSAYGTTVAVLTCPFLPRAGTVPVGADILTLQDTLKLLRETAKQASAI